MAKAFAGPKWKATDYRDLLSLLFLPRQCPELNPMERVWQDSRNRLSVDLPADLHALADDVGRVICEYTPQTLASIVGYPYLRQISAQLT